MPAVGHLDIGSLAKPGSRERTHLSVVARVGMIVAVAIVCVIVAVMTSAYRADEVALEQERQLFTRAIADHGGRVLREIENVTAADRAVHHIHVERNLLGIQQRIGEWLETHFDHEFAFVIDEQDRFLDPLANLNRGLMRKVIADKMAAALTVYVPWLLVLLVVAVLPSLLGETHFASLGYSLLYSWTPERRQLDYLRYIGASDISAKELKLFGLSDFLVGRYARLSNEFYEANKALAVRRSVVSTPVRRYPRTPASAPCITFWVFCVAVCTCCK